MTDDPAPPQTPIPDAVIDAFALAPDSIEPLPGGHINRSFAARQAGAGACVLQQVNPIFAPAVNDDIDAVTGHLAGKGLVTPRIVPTLAGARCLEADGGVWRLLTRIDGETHEAVADDAMAREAGRVLGRFHAALADFDAPLAGVWPGTHDLARHLGHLDATLAARSAHPAHAAVAAIAGRIGAVVAAARLQPAARAAAADAGGAAGGGGPLAGLPKRLVHGDPKISNVIFAGGRGVCLVDLDTIGRFPAVLELGDACRSWCNTAAEDSPAAGFSLSRFAAALAGYRAAAAGFLTAEEWRLVPAATLAIAAELAARFAADALDESYFAWDRTRYDSASAHNLARARAQLALAGSIRDAWPELRALAVTRA